MEFQYSDEQIDVIQDIANLHLSVDYCSLNKNTLSALNYFEINTILLAFENKTVLSSLSYTTH